MGMGMSNYPPGVTGGEYMIAGPDLEEDAVRRCGAEGVTVHTISTIGKTRLRTSLEAMRIGTMVGVAQAQRDLFDLDADVEAVTLVACPFEGEVTVQWYHGTEMWVCPLCRTEHQTDVE